MAVDLVIVCVLLLMLLASALVGWWGTLKTVRDLEHDLDMAIGWAEACITTDAVVHPTLHLVEGETS